MVPITDLLHPCTVKLSLPGRSGWGTGFFVAPGLLLTCAHVVRNATDGQVSVSHPAWQQSLSATVQATADDGATLDIALVQLMDPLSNHLSVLLDEELQPGDDLYFFGYPDQDFANGCPVTVSCEGYTGDVPPLIKFKLGQVRPGMSGSALLNQRTGKVCGMVKFTRDKSFDLGGGAIPTRVILEQFPQLRDRQQQFHQQDSRWHDRLPTSKAVAPITLDSNPYKGLLSFEEQDSANFFGRSQEIQALSQKFWQVQKAEVRLLLVSGKSGSGKSSLVRAGLIPKLREQPFPKRGCGQVVVLTPNRDPFRSLAAELAPLLAPLNIDQVKEKLRNPEQAFDGLRAVVAALPHIDHSPLIVVIDQFEEIYSPSNDQERNDFVENLLCAASHPAQQVSVVLVMRDEFQRSIKQHPRLSQLFASSSHKFPLAEKMKPEQLEQAITEPAKRARHRDLFNQELVYSLLEQTQDLDLPLPLLQVTLSEIWHGLCQGINPTDRLKKMGGVANALTDKAQAVYGSLDVEQQQIARSIFLALVQINDNDLLTRCRLPISELVNSYQNEELIYNIINHFAEPGVWILVTTDDDQQGQVVEVAHEALLTNWIELQGWIKTNQQSLRQRQDIRQAAEKWQKNGKSQGYLWSGSLLVDAKKYWETHKNNPELALSNLTTEFVQVSLQKQKNNRLLLSLCLIPLLGAITLIPKISEIIQDSQIRNAKKIVFEDKENKCPVNRDAPPDQTTTHDPTTKRALEYLIKQGYAEQLAGVKLCSQSLQGIDLSPKKDPQSKKEILVDMHNSDLRKANLSDAKLRGISLEDANLRGTFLPGADFTTAFLDKADFTGAILENANLENAFLDGTIFTNVNLKGAKLIGTHLENARGLNPEQLNQAVLCRVELPKNDPEIIKKVNPNRDCSKL